MAIDKKLTAAYNEISEKKLALASKEDAMERSYKNALEHFSPHLAALAKTFEPKGKSGEGLRFLFRRGKTTGGYAYKIEVALAETLMEQGQPVTKILNRYNNPTFGVPIELVIGVDRSTKDGNDLCIFFKKGKDEKDCYQKFRDGQYDSAEPVFAEWLKYIGSATLISEFQRHLKDELKGRPSLSKRDEAPNPPTL